MRDFGAYAVAVAIVLSVFCCANLAFASQTVTPISTTAAIGTAPVGDDLSLIDIGGFLRQVGGFIRIGITTLISGSGGNGLGPTEPTDLVATPVSSSEIDLSWSPSTDNIGVAGYQVFRDGLQVATDTSGTTYNDTGLSPSTLHSYWVAAYDSANNVSTSTNGVSAETEAGADTYGTAWKPLTLGAGGDLTGMDIALDGTIVVRADTYGAYLWDGTRWDQLLTANSMPADVQIPNGGDGVNEIRIAPSNSNIMYMEYEGYVFKSINRGVTWTQTNFAQVPEAVIEGGDTYRQWGQKMAIDPENPNVVYVGTRQSGLFISTNGGTSWQNEATVATGTVNNGTYYAGINGIQFDPILGVSGGKTETIFASAAGDGVYESTTAGATWTLLSGGPSTVIYSAIGNSTGTYYAVDDNNNLWSYAGGTWTELLSGADGIVTVSVDPFNNNEIVVTSNAGFFDISYNAGSTWSGYDTFFNGSYYNELSSTDIPWLANTGPFMDVDALIFDPITQNKLWAADGVGVWETTSVPSSGFSNEATVTWNDQSLGIEQLVTNSIVTPPGGDPVVAAQDRPFFYKTTPDAYPSYYSPVMGDTIVAGDSIDYASSNPNFLVGLADSFGHEESGYSTDGGQTWSFFPTFIPGADSSFIGGTIAASTPTNIIWAPADGFDPYYTTDGGNTWNAITLPGVSSWTGFDFAYYLDARTVTADRVLPNTFYLYYNGSGGTDGVYETTNGGASGTRNYSGLISPNSTFNVELESVPGEAGHLFFTGGYQTVATTTSGEGFYQSTNGGTTWNAIPNVTEVNAFDFGKAAPGTTTPAIYIAGWVSNVYGIWESDNDGVSWAQIGQWPTGSMDYVKTVSGDMNSYGRVYIGTAGDGYYYANTANAQISPLISNISSGTPTTTSATITWTTDQASNSQVTYGTSTSYGSFASNGSLVTSHSVTLSGLSAATTYHFEVASANSQGYTATSTDQSFSTVNPTPPSTPTGLTITSDMATAVGLSWSASTGNGTDPVEGYRVFRNSSQIATTSTTTYSDTSVSQETSYTYTVDAYDSVGNVSGQSGAVSTTTPSGVTWTPTAAPATQYLVYPSPSTVTFSNVNIGTATSSRIVVVGAEDYDAPACPMASVTIGGTSATEATTTTEGRTSLWYASVSSGTSANIVLTCTGGGSFENVGIQVGTLTGAIPTPASTGVFNFAYEPQPQSVTATVPANGVGVIFAAEGEASTSTPPVPSWTNATGDSYSNDTDGDSNPVQIILAHTYVPGSQTPSLSSGNGTSYSYIGTTMVMATWAP